MPRRSPSQTSRRAAAKSRPKGMANRAYRRSELAILGALLKAAAPRDNTTAPPDQNLYTLEIATISRLAQVSRATIYRHHRKLAAILLDLETFLLNTFYHRIREITKKSDASPRDLYLETLLFILAHRPFYQVLIMFGRTNCLEFQVRHLLPYISKFYKFSRHSPLFLRLYEKRIAALLEIWVRSDFEPSESVIVGDILYFTQTFPSYFRAIRHHFPPQANLCPPATLHPLG